MKQALGLVEIAGLSTAIVAADAMAKAANIEIVEVENTKGLGYMTIKAVGDVGAVKAAVDVGRQVGIMHGKLVSYKVIPRPSDYVEQYFVDPDDGAKKKPEELPAEAEEKAEIETADPEAESAEAAEVEEAEPEKVNSEAAEPESAEAESTPEETKPAKKAPSKSTKKKGSDVKKESGQNEIS